MIDFNGAMLLKLAQQLLHSKYLVDFNSGIENIRVTFGDVNPGVNLFPDPIFNFTCFALKF